MAATPELLVFNQIDRLPPGEGRAIASLAPSLLDGPPEFLVNHPLHPFQAGRGPPSTAFENLTNLDLLPAAGAFVVALPMKIKGGSGAPLRAVAFLL